MENSSLRQVLAYSITLSSTVIGHDGNPGNIMIADNKIARVDFSHALNDLINTLKKIW